MSVSSQTKKKFIRLLREDEEFRYAVAGMLGMEDLRRSSTRLEDAVARLAEAQQRTEERVGRLEDAVARLAEAQQRTDAALKELAVQVGKLSEVIGFGLEDIAQVVVPGWLYRHEGIEVEVGRTFFVIDGEEVQVDLYGDGKKNGETVKVVGEVRSRIYGRDVEEFDRKVKIIENYLGMPAYKLMFGYLIHPSASKEAERRGITLIASYMR
ncbi:MAG: hypothetical protein QXO01_00065 [Nitrososphaerota archaeon]